MLNPHVYYRQQSNTHYFSCVHGLCAHIMARLWTPDIHFPYKQDHTRCPTNLNTHKHVAIRFSIHPAIYILHVLCKGSITHMFDREICVQELKSSVMFLWHSVYFGRQVFKLQSRCWSSHSRDSLVLFSVTLLKQSDPSSVWATCSCKNNWWMPDGNQFDCNAAWIKPQGSIISAFMGFFKSFFSSSSYISTTYC